MDFVEWFDVDDLGHIKAYCHLERTGFWPKGFIPDNVVMHPQWALLLQSKMADAWVHHMRSITPIEQEEEVPA